jgi:hypothetical protein
MKLNFLKQDLEYTGRNKMLSVIISCAVLMLLMKKSGQENGNVSLRFEYVQ